uniref:Putative ADP-ribosylation factor GTPase-activating protein AGD14 n=1 Tax=Davidia involucrata TaxID=16924 RepID=A0A5B6ZKX4_DAVIN
MSHRIKEEERIERIIRGLLKLPENRRCINCNSLGPQYVCTTFWTFVCTNCSGVHREFTHRVKSVSMAKFNAEEVNSLQAGGNERARQIYFKAWDPQRHSFPDGSNLHRLRDFIKHVYVDRKYTGERNDKLPVVKVGAKEDFYERRSIERSSSGVRKDDRRYYFDERSRPRHKQENVRSSGPRSRPFHFEIVDDRFRDDGFGSGRRSESRRLSNAESRAGSMSPDSQSSREITSPPVLRPMRVGKQTKANDEKDAGGSAHVQKTTTSSSPGSVDGKLVEQKRVNSSSLIDFHIDPRPSDTAAVPQTEQMAPSTAGGNLALVQSSTKDKASDARNANSLEFLLFELSAPAVEPVKIMSEAPGSGNTPLAAPAALSNSVSATATAAITNTPVVHTNGGAPAASPIGMAPVLLSSSGDSMVTAAQQLPTMQQNQPSAYPAGDSSSTAQQTNPSVGALGNQPWTSLLARNTQGPSNASADQFSQAASKPAQHTSSGVGAEALPVVDTKSNGRRELPVDLFTASYLSFPAPVPSWQMHPPHGMGFSMQYHPTTMHVPAFPRPAKSTNPFDLSDDTTQVQAPMFPSMSSLQGALPNTSAPAASFGIYSPQLMQPQSFPYASAVPPRSPSYGMTMSPSGFMGQQLPNNMSFSRPQGIGGFGGGEVAFASLNTTQQSNGRYTEPATPNSFSLNGGNPFG